VCGVACPIYRTALVFASEPESAPPPILHALSAAFRGAMLKQFTSGLMLRRPVLHIAGNHKPSLRSVVSVAPG
jgi:hypothetical protein